MVRSPLHLLWIPAGAGVGFTMSLVFGDLLTLPLDLYYLIYFTAVLAFLAFYVRRTHFDLAGWLSRRLAPGLLLGVLGGAVLVAGVLRRPATEPLAGALLWWAVVWRGVAYGAVDGLLLLAFPWVVVWRAMGAEERGGRSRSLAAAVAWMAILVVTTAYHLGYRDFRSAKLIQPNIGSSIGAVPTLVSANPVASPISHLFLHVAAVLHSPHTDLFLPPHRPAGPEAVSRARPGEGEEGDSGEGGPEESEPVQTGG